MWIRMKCEYCNKEIGRIEGCSISHVKIGNEIYERNKMDPFEPQCHDCGAGSGNYHHPGCDVEDCPKCRGQMLWCNCFEDIEFIAK